MLGTPQGGTYPSANDAMAAAGILAASAAAAASQPQVSGPPVTVPQQYGLPSPVVKAPSMVMQGPPAVAPPPPPPQMAAQPAPVAAAAGSAAAAAQQYMLQWHEHHDSFFRLMEELCQSQAMTDVTVACGDVSLEAHSLILSASSPILRSGFIFGRPA